MVNPLGTSKVKPLKPAPVAGFAFKSSPVKAFSFFNCEIMCCIVRLCVVKLANLC